MTLASTWPQAVWYLNALTQLRYTTSITIMAHNTSMINVAENVINNARTTQIDVVYHVTREHLINNAFTLSYLSSHDKTADLMTEGLDSVSYHGHAQCLGLSE